MIPIETPSQILSELNLQEDDCQTVACIVCDTHRNAKKVNINVPATATCQTLLGRVANRLGYSSGTFLLYYQEPDGAENAEEGVCLNDLPTASLQSIVGSNLRQNFYVTMKESEAAEKDEFLNTADNTEDMRRNTDSAEVKPIQLVSIINDCSTSNLSNSKENKVNYGSYSLSSALIKSDTGFVGLVNQAMTCYLNSLLQTLYMTPEFRNAVYRWEYEGTLEEAVKSIPYQLQKLFLMLQTSDKKSVGTTDITKSFGWDSSDAWHQHDIQELCRVMFDALEKTWQNTEQADLINQLYQGRMKDCVQCLQCGWESSKTVAYQDIPLAVKPFGEGRAYSTVEESLRAFCSHELLDGNNQWFCEKCGKKVDAHKSLKFLTFPYLLTMHLMRFDFDYNTLRRIKLNHRISFPEVLNLNDFTVKTDSTSTDGIVTTGQSSEQETANGTTAFSANSESACSSNDFSAMDSLESESPAGDPGSYPKGPYEYQLFSIMVHSGNASGGHYYAYIKSFEREQWFSFNDQNVSAITYDDIKKTYGGSSSVHGHYSSSFASSTNAYMLMYRRIDKERNAKFMRLDQFPVHLQRELKRMQDKEDSERRQQEMERNTCKIKLFVFHPVEQKFLETTLAVHMNKTLAEATEVAWKLFELEGIVPLDCVRLVKYDGPHDYIDRSFDGDEAMPMHRILGGIKFFYGFDLLLEVKQPGQSFTTYKPGGISVKVYVVDLASETISFPVTVRAALSQTVGELRELIAGELRVSTDCLRCVLEMHSDLKQLQDPGRLLKVEGFTKSNKIFVEVSTAEDETEVDFKNSHLFEILDRFENTIRIHVQLPISTTDIDGTPLDSVETSSKNSFTTSSETAPLYDDSSLKLSSDFWNSDSVAAAGASAATNDVSHLPPSDAEAGISDPVNCNSNASLSKASAAIVSNDSEPTVLSLTSEKLSQELCCDETRTKNGALSGTLEEVSTDALGTENGASTWEMDRGDWVSAASTRESMYRSYFRATLQVNAETKERSLSVALDKRITLESLKICLQSYVGATSDNFEVHRVTSNGEEMEMKRLTESLTMCDDDCQFKVKIGRPLQKGEHRIKVHQLLINDPEPIKFLTEVVISKGMTVLQAKMSILRELKLKQIMEVPPVDRCRLRRKCWKNPGNIYSDCQAFDGQDICIVPNMDLLLEVLDAPDQLRIKREEQLSIYVRQWSPSKYELGGIREIIVDEDSSNDLIKKISAVSELKEETVQFCKISGVVFPYDMSVFEIHTGLSWIPRDNTHSTLKTLSVYSDGAVFFYRDKTEPLKVLTSEEKKELQQRENARVLPASSSITSSWRKERALKIYLDETPKASSACS